MTKQTRISILSPPRGVARSMDTAQAVRQAEIYINSRITYLRYHNLTKDHNRLLQHHQYITVRADRNFLILEHKLLPMPQYYAS